MPTFPLDPNMPHVETVSPVGDVHPSIRERIERGVAWLDEVKPDWRTCIDQDTLDIADSAYCVLGQVFQAEAHADDCGYGYVYRRYVSSDSRSWMANRGFDSLNISPGAYADLEAAWQRYLDGEW